MASSLTFSADKAPLLSFVDAQNTMCAEVPTHPLTEDSLQVTVCEEELPYSQWTEQNHTDSYTLLQRIVSIWKTADNYHQYMVYGHQELSTNKAFSWEIVPYQATDSLIKRFWQQFLSLWRISFGAAKLSDEKRASQINDYKFAFQQTPTQNSSAEGAAENSDDPFCRIEILNKQRVLEGHSINVLYNYAPIGFGGERLHFLLVPKEHRETFSELTEEEYVEATQLTKRIIGNLSSSRELQSAYLFHKTGVDAGQTVPHWHMHLILTSNRAQGIFGKLSVLKNMLIGSKPLSNEELQIRVQQYQSELANPL